MLSQCPGSSHIKQPTLEIKICPQCGDEIEMFSIDITAKCDTCGFVAYNDLQSCIQWCKYARQCVGDAIYDQLMRSKT